MPEIIVLSLGSRMGMDRGAYSRIFDALTAAGFEFQIRTGLREFFMLLRDGCEQIVVVDALDVEDFDEYMLVSMIRSSSQAGIVLFAGGQSDGRIKGFNSGADICLSTPVDEAEVVAALASLCRRMGLAAGSGQVSSQVSGAAPALAAQAQSMMASELSRPALPAQSRVWILDIRKWHLRSPDGAMILLRDVERSFLKHLFQMPDRVLRRGAWEGAAGKDNEYSNYRRVNDVVSRLRHRLDKLSINFPLYTLRGVGYQFAEECQVVDEVPEH